MILVKKLFLFAICGAGLVFGWGMARFLTPSPAVLQQAAESAPVSEADSPLISEDTRLVVRYSFGGCGHFDLKEEKMPSTWVGKPASSVSLPGTLFESFENNIVYLAKISRNKCGSHFILTAQGNQLIVTYQNDPSRVRDRHDFRPQLLPEAELAKLKEGIYLESEEELTRTLEDYCS